MIELNVTDRFKELYPLSAMGILVVRDIANVKKSDALQAEKKHLEEKLRAKFSSREEVKADSTLQAYGAHYKLFGNNYHVFFQVESVAVKGKPIPSVNALVEAMFMGELEHMLLTAGHDMDKVEGAIRLEAANGEERFIKINGEEQQLKVKDMFVADSVSVLSSVIYGPDKRTMITTDTKRVLFTIYAPDGITRAQLEAQMDTIEGYIRMFSPDAVTETKAVFP